MVVDFQVMWRDIAKNVNDVAQSRTVAFADVIGMSNDVSAARIVASMLMSAMFGLVYGVVIARITSKSIKMASHFFCGIFFALYLCGYDSWHFLFSIALTHLIMKFALFFKRPVLGAYLVFITETAHLLIGYWFTETETYDICWTLQQCLLTLRLIGYAFDVSDGQDAVNIKDKDKEAAKLLNMPNMFELISFCLTPCGFISGPQYPYRLFLNFIDNNLFSRQGLNPGGRYLKGTLRILTAVFYAAFYLGISGFFPDNFLQSTEFEQSSLAWKLVTFGILQKIWLAKYFPVWLLADAACIFSGLGYSAPIAPNTTSDWSGCSNLLPFEYETSTSLSGIIGSFNVQTNLWVRRYIYKRLVPFLDKTLVQILCMFYLAMWHGFSSGYYFCFGLEIIALKAEGSIVRFANFAFPSSPFFLFLRGLAGWCLRSVTLGYALVAFHEKVANKYMPVYNSVYHVVAVIVVILMLGNMLIPVKKVTKEEPLVSKKKE